MNLGQVLAPQEAMARAIAEAHKGWGRVSPNPLVGCVIVNSQHQLIGVGAHLKVGGAHAEMEALNSVRDKSEIKGAIVYVTLEPCAHQGRTPSCARHLAQLPISKVVYGLMDPHPLVGGKGAQILEESGIKAEKFEGLHDELEDLAEHFLMNQRKSLPFVALKVATTFDGFMGTLDGRSQWITSEDARVHARRLRAGFDAVAVGINTLIKDNPRLDLRGVVAGAENRVIVLDPNGRGVDFLRDAEVTRVRHSEKVIWVTGPEVKCPPSGIKHLTHSLEQGQFDLQTLLNRLYQKNVTSIFVEGGAYTLSQFLAQGVAHRLYNFISMTMLGGVAGLSWTKYLATPGLDQRIKILNAKCEILSNNELLISGRFVSHSAFNG